MVQIIDELACFVFPLRIEYSPWDQPEPASTIGSATPMHFPSCGKGISSTTPAWPRSARGRCVRKYADEAESDVYIGTKWHIDIEKLRAMLRFAD